MTEIALSEGGEPVILALDDHVGVALDRSGFVAATRVGGGEWSIAPLQKIGVAAIAGLTVRVRPKIPIRRVLFLLGYAHRPGWRDDSVTMSEVDDLVPALAEAFVVQAEKALERGLLQGYLEVEDALPILRGRLRTREQLQRRFGITTPLLVRFDDHQIDVAENRILRGATELLLRLPGVAAGPRSRLRRLRQVLAEVTPPLPGAPLPVWRPNRLNERYQPALWLAELLLARNAVDQAAGQIRLGGFVVDMAKVFEDFLCAALGRELRKIGGFCRPQDRHHLDVDGEIAMRPDLVWYRAGRPAAVIDAKYKAEKPSGFPDADLYQMLAYCTALDLREGHLVYAKGNAPERRHVVRHAGITIHAHALDLDAEPRVVLRRVSMLAEMLAATSHGHSP